MERLIPWRRALVGWGFGLLSGERGDYVNLGALILRLPAGICIGRGEGGHEGVRKAYTLWCEWRFLCFVKKFGG